MICRNEYCLISSFPPVLYLAGEQGNKGDTGHALKEMLKEGPALIYLIQEKNLSHAMLANVL